MYVLEEQLKEVLGNEQEFAQKRADIVQTIKGEIGKGSSDEAEE